MLKHKKDPITDIALALGFQDINYFSRAFRKEAGMSPMKFRCTLRSANADGLPD